MTKDEALQVALNAFGEIAWSNDTQWQAARAKVAIAAIKAVNLGPLSENGTYRLGYHHGYGFGEAYAKANTPQRTWQGLTEDDKVLIKHDADFNQFISAGEYADRVQQLTEARLKDKNT